MEKAEELIKFSIAKTVQTKEGTVVLGMSVFLHCLITGLVARELVSTMPADLQSLFPEGSIALAAIHDVGKVNELFQEKIRRRIPCYLPNSELALVGADPSYEKFGFYHNDVSCLTLRELGLENCGRIVGSHHGFESSTTKSAMATCIGGGEWQNAREKLIRKLTNFFRQSLPSDKLFSRKQEICSIVAGLTTVSDWISSSIDLPEIKSDEISPQSINVVSGVVRKAGFFKPIYQKNLNFQQIFNGWTPNQLQSSLIQMLDGPGVYIVEAQMGEGKTEAALYAAYKILEEGKASGIYFALPTQLTSNKIFERFSSFLKSILLPSDQHLPLLVHSDSWLYETSLGGEGEPGFSWFDSRKRALLAPFAVGTIDQALLSVINCKHNFVRLFGLANKVVILDEVHSYDSYTQRLIQRLIEVLRKLRCTVIILSATLTNQAKRGLLKLREDQVVSTGYPQIGRLEQNNMALLTSVFLSTERHVILSYVEDDDARVMDSVREKAINGEQILWIENTVSEAQEVFKVLAAWGHEIGVDVGLIHSRFTRQDRTLKEAKWVSLFGPEGQKQRDVGRILVGTQVLEQSLDIDADYLVSRIAPVDLILQRVGRLYRHRSIDKVRPGSSRPEVVILSRKHQDIIKQPSIAFGKTGTVYSPYVLFMASEVLREKKELNLPSDIPVLLEKAYGTVQNLPKTISSELSKMMKNTETLIRKAGLNMSMIGHQSDEVAQTRYIEEVSCPVLLLQRLIDESTGRMILQDGTELTLTSAWENLEKRKSIARKLEMNIVNVRTLNAPTRYTGRIMELLEHFVFCNVENYENCLRIGICDNNGRVRNIYGPDNQNFELFYDSTIGYRCCRRESIA